MRYRLQPWLQAVPIQDPIERRQAMLVQVILLGLSGVLLCSALLTLLALPFTRGAMAAANLDNTISNSISALFVLVPLAVLRLGYFRVAVAILMAELYMLAFNTFYPEGLEAGWIGVLELALPLSLAGLVLGRRWLWPVYLASVAGVAATALRWYPLEGLPTNAPSAIIAFALIAGLLALFLDRFGGAFRDALAALRESEERYRLITENAGDLISLIDHDGRLVYASPSHRSVLGLHPERLIGSPAIANVHPDDRDRWPTLAGSARTRIRCRHADGSWRWFEASSTAVTWQRQRYLLVVSRDVTERVEAEEALARNYDLLAAIVNGTPDAMYIKDSDGRYLMINAAGAQLFGRSVDEVINKDDRALFGADAAPLLAADRSVTERGQEETHEHVVTIDGVARTYLSTRLPYRDRQGKVVGVIGISRDITEHRRLEAQLVQAQKMESIGRLAGGIAHDFNNMLSVVIGFINSAREELAPDSLAHHDLEVAENAAWRGANLTRQLLAFARKQVVEPRVLDLNVVILDLEKMLRRLIGENIELVTRPAPNLGAVRADPGHIEQVIVNLAVNARDAMLDGGQLTIETADTELDEDYARQHHGVIPGRYVMLAVSDTGVGMDATVRQEIFEPFFTTKEVGRGTGLGLATCYGIIKQHGGHIWVYSELGRGTTFKIYLPRVDETPDSLMLSGAGAALPRGDERVLLVEDETLVRELAATALHQQGYTVLTAASGEEALRIAQDAGDAPIDLLITDVVMPGMGGKALADQVSQLYPGIRVLFISGYATDAITQHGQLSPGVHFLSKPFSRAAIARKVRAVLDAEADGERSAEPRR